MRRHRRPFGAVPFLLALGVAVSAAPIAVSAQTVTVNWNFLRFRGPSDLIENVDNPTSTFGAGVLINGIRPTLNGSAARAATGVKLGPNEGYALGEVTGLSGTSVAFGYDNRPISDNQISFTPFSLSPETGVPFRLGTLSFTNGAFYGANRVDPFSNVPSYFDFRLETQSANAAFNQTFEGSVVLVVHSPAAADYATLAGQQAEADWVYLTGENTGGTNPVPGLQTTNALRVYDGFAAPKDALTTGTVELWAQFGSLTLLELRNPTGGNFVTASVGALDPQTGNPITTVPEPTSVLLLVTGLAGAALLRVCRKNH
jgi:hypothetical protein